MFCAPSTHSNSVILLLLSNYTKYDHELTLHRNKRKVLSLLICVFCTFVICVLWFVYNIFFAHMVISPSIYKASCSFKWVCDKWPKVNSRYVCFALKRTWKSIYLTNCKHYQGICLISLPDYPTRFYIDNSTQYSISCIRDFVLQIREQYIWGT